MKYVGPLDIGLQLLLDLRLVENKPNFTQISMSTLKLDRHFTSRDGLMFYTSDCLFPMQKLKRPGSLG